MNRYETLTVVAPWKKHIDANNKISYHGQSAASDIKQCEQDLSSWRIQYPFIISRGWYQQTSTFRLQVDLRNPRNTS